MVHPGEYIPPVGTLADTPPVQAINTISFTLYLPAGPKPPNGWPVAIHSGGTSRDKHFSTDDLRRQVRATPGSP